jgi:putative transposase
VTFQLIDMERAHHAVSLLCSVLGVTRQGYWAWRGSRQRPGPRRLQDERLKPRITALWQASRESYGAPRLMRDLRDEGVRVGTKRVARLMRELGIHGVSRRRGRAKTTTPDPKAAPAPDLVERQFTAIQPDETWVADITYVPTHQGWLFLACVMDLYSRRIVGWSMRDDLEAQLVVDAVSMAIARRQPRPGLVHHSDRGGQYTSLAMGRTLRDSKIVASMGSVGDPWDNACAESCISTIKMELVRRRTFQTRDQARLAVFDYIEAFYNPHRRHSTLGYQSPDAYEAQYWSTKHDQQESDAAGGDVSRREQSGKGLPLPASGLTEPAEASRPALTKGAPAGLETPYHQEAVA